MAQDHEQWGFSATAHATGMTTAVTSTAAFSFAFTAPKPVTKIYPITVDLPERHLIGIAKVMLRWSVQEWLLQQVLFALVTADEGIARVTIATGRSKSVLDRIE